MTIITAAMQAVCRISPAGRIGALLGTGANANKLSKARGVISSTPKL